MVIGRALIHEFLSRSNSYYEIKCSTGIVVGENYYSFYLDCCNPCFKYTNLIFSCEWWLQSLLSINRKEVEHEITNDLIWHMYRHN